MVSDMFVRLLDSSDFVPRRLCGNWTPGLIALHNISDALIWLAYLAIPVALLVLARRRQNVPFRKVFFLFFAFIITCGFTHAFDVVMFYSPLYRISGLLKALTAVSSWATVFALIQVLPQALAMRNPEELEREIAERKRIQGDLRLLHAELELRIAQRTAELARALTKLEAENEERQRIEREVWESREQLRLVTDNAPVMLVHSDAEGRYKFANRAYAEMLATTPQDIVGRRVAEVIGAHAYQAVRAHVDAALAGQRVEVEIDGPYKGTGHQRLRYTCLPSYTDSGQVSGAIEVILDVTEHRKAENLLRTITDTVPALISYIGPDGCYRLNNRAYEDWFGLGPTSVFGRHAREVLGDEAWTLVQPQMEAAFAGRVARFEAEVPFRSGGSRWVEGTYTPHWESGAVVGVVAFISDITHRREAEQAVRASESRFRGLADAIPQIVWTARPDGTFDYCNDRWYDYTGFARDLVDANRWRTLVHPDDLDECARAWSTALRSGGPYEVEYRFRNGRTGLYRWHLARAVAVRDESGTVIRWLGTGTDIEDQKRAAQILQDLNSTLERQVAERTLAAESASRVLDAILDALPVAVIIADPTGRLTRFNRACEQVWGLAPHSGSIDEYREWIGYWPDTGRQIEPHDWAMSRALLKGAVVPGELLEFVRFGDGSRRLIINSGAPVWGPDGELLAAVVAGLDVTDRIAAQAALKESEERFHGAFNLAPIGMALVAPDGRWLQVNRSLCELLGYTEQELQATDYQTLTHSDDLALHAESMGVVLTGTQRVYQLEKRYFHKQGHVVHVLSSGSLIRDRQGRASYFIVQIKDITQRKQDERALAATQALLRQFIKHSPAAIAMFDLNMCYLQASDRWMTDFGLSGQDLSGCSHYQVYPAHQAKWTAVHQRVLAGAVERCAEDRFEAEDGTEEWLEWECRPWVKPDGEIGGLLMFMHVITERKLAEEQIKASLREKEVLLKEIHHRVKNNLQVVSTLLDLQSSHTTDPAAIEMFKESRGRVRSMALIHARLYRAQDFARVDFAEYVRQLVHDLHRAYKLSEGIRLEIDVDIPPLTIDLAIPLGLLLNELISNCFKHAFVGAAEGCLAVALHPDGDMRVLTVRDDGPGFPPQRDFRNSASFGLQLVNTLVQQLEGEINLTSPPGTTFTVRFPGTSR